MKVFKAPMAPMLLWLGPGIWGPVAFHLHGQVEPSSWRTYGFCKGVHRNLMDFQNLEGFIGASCRLSSF